MTCYCGCRSVTAWRGRPVCNRCLLRCVRQAVANVQPIDEPDIADHIRNRSPLADAQRYAPGVMAVQNGSGEFTRQLNKAMDKHGIPRHRPGQWSRGENL